MKRIIGYVILLGNSSFFPEPSEKIQNIQTDVRNVGYYRKLLENLQEISNRKTKPISIFNFKKKFRQAGSGFQGVTDRQWRLIDPLLNKKIIRSGRHPRRHLNSIFSVIMNRVPIDQLPVTSNFSGPTSFREYFTAWKEDGTLKKVLTRLIEEAQGTVQSDYRKALDRL